MLWEGRGNCPTTYKCLLKRRNNEDSGIGATMKDYTSTT